MTTTLIKQPSETRVYQINFADLLSSGDHINSITSVTASSTDLTIGTPTIIDTAIVQFTVAGGVDGATYLVEAIVVTHDGETLEGDGYLLVADQPLLDSGSLGWDYTSLREEIAHFCGWGRDSSKWSAAQIMSLDRWIKSGLHQVYFPPRDQPNRRPYRWSFLYPPKTLTTSAPYSTGTVAITNGVVTLTGGTWPSWAAGEEITVDENTYRVSTRDGDNQLTLEDTSVDAVAGTRYSLGHSRYDLPTDFGGIEGELTYSPGAAEGYPPIELTTARALRFLRQGAILTDRPARAAVSPKAFVGSSGQRWELLLDPTPDAIYTLHYTYKVIPTMPSEDQPYLLGGTILSEVILESCLSIAEQRQNENGQFIHTTKFKDLLAAAIAADEDNKSPGTLGPDGGGERYRESRYPLTPVLTMNGEIL